MEHVEQLHNLDPGQMTCIRNDERNGLIFHGHGQPEPIGLEYIAACLQGRGYRVSIRNSNEVMASNGECISLCLLSGVSCEYELLARAAVNAKERGDITILGGYHSSSMELAGAPKTFDHIVIGEGEHMAVALARVLLDGEEVDVDGYHLSPGNVPRVLKSARIDDLDSLPFPLRSEGRLGAYILYDLMWPPTSQQKNTAIVLTSRGCRHNCDFCASSSVWGQGVRYRSIDNIIAELRELKARFNTNTIVIIDQSFGQERQWTLEVCNAIQDADLGMNWYHQSNLTIHRDVIKAMADAGCTKIGFGLEGLSPRAAQRVKPVHPHDFEQINDLFDYCTSLGLFVKAYLMIGFPWEDEDIIQEYFEWLPRLRASQIKISYMTPFPGTAYWEKYSDQLVTNNWSHFDTVSMPVVRNPRITVDQYHQLRQDLFHAFYGTPAFAEGVRRMIERFPHYAFSYREFCNYLAHHGMITGKEEWLSLVGWSKYPQATVAQKGRV